MTARLLLSVSAGKAYQLNPVATAPETMMVNHVVPDRTGNHGKGQQYSQDFSDHQPQNKTL